MNRKACATAIAIIALSLTATAQEKKITQSALPAPVQKTVQANSQGASHQGLHRRNRERQANVRS